MNIVDAMILLRLSPFDSTEALERAYANANVQNINDASIHEAYRIVQIALIGNGDLSGAIRNSDDLNRILKAFEPEKYPAIFESIERNLNNIIKSKGNLVITLQGLSTKGLTHAVTILRNNLPNFNLFAINQINPNPKPLTLFDVGQRAIQGKFPEGERVIATLFPSTMTRQINNSSSWIKGLVPVHRALRSGLIANQVQDALTNAAIHSKDKSVALTSALVTQDMLKIRATYDALIKDTGSTFSNINYQKAGTSLMFAAASCLSFFLATESSALNYTLLVAQLSTAAFVLKEIYTNKDFLISLTQKQTVDRKRENLNNILSHMEPEFLTHLNRALGLGLSGDELRDSALLKTKLEAYTAETARTIYTTDEGWCHIGEAPNQADAGADHDNDDINEDWDTLDVPLNDSPTRGSPPGF